MSLVITVWDKSLGIAVCEGRAIAKVNGTKIPVCEDHSKLSRLPDGSILGLTGGLRPGYEATAMDGVVTEPLRCAIHAKAETHGFRELCGVIPELLTEYGTKYPELAFGVSLLGNDNGAIRGASWSSTCPACIPEGSDVSANVLGLSAEANHEALDAVNQYIAAMPRNYVHVADTVKVLQGVIKDVAARHVELNDHLQVECVTTSEKREALDWSGLLTDGSTLTTAGVITQTAQTSMAAALNTGSFAAIPGLSFTVTTASTNDVYNISAMLILLATSAAQAEIELLVDGSGAAKQNVTFSLAGTGVPIYAPFLASVTGLSAGTHTLQFYGYTNGSVNLEALSYAMCQRVF